MVSSTEYDEKEISVEKFYSLKPNALEIFEVFPLQDMAFQYVDSLPLQKRMKCKVFSFETKISGKRKFLVASFESLIREYYTALTSDLDRHFYEIIRDNYPCRLYFDLEFAIPEGISDEEYTNWKDRGNRATHTWISLVLWKLFEEFSIELGFENVILLDSTNKTKFSKHIVIIIIDRGDLSSEIFIKDNLSITYLLYTILSTITTQSPHFRSHFDEAQSSTIEPNEIEARMPLPQFAHLWFSNSDGKQAFIVDLGVYSRNRAFRILGSCKYGKQMLMKVDPSDSEIYRGILDHSIQSNASLHDIKLSRLERSFVLSYGAIELYHNGLLTNLLDFSVLDNSLKLSSINLSRDFGTLEASICKSINRQNKPRLSYIKDKSGSTDMAVVAYSERRNVSSPFPLLDNFVFQVLGSVGGVKGEINGWRIYCYRDRNPPIYRIRYQVLNNRWCHRINRQHKSNNIMLEVDFMSRSVYQVCWDPECRGYRSEPVFINPSIIPSFDELQQLYQTSQTLANQD